MAPVTVADVAIEEVAAWVRDAAVVVALTGAGISTESGIPDFRGPNGVWTKDPKAERLSNIHHYMADPEVRELAWRSRLNHPAWTAAPNAGHMALAELERRGHLHLLVTQNIDGLHQAAGTGPGALVEIHGTMREVMCMSCGERAPMELALERVRAGEADPPCRSCGGILKSATISFGQGLVAEDLDRAIAGAAHCNLLLAVGTSLGVYPAAGMVPVALAAGARLVVFNAEPTPFDADAAAVVRRPIGMALTELVSLV